MENYKKLLFELVKIDGVRQLKRDLNRQLDRLENELYFTEKEGYSKRRILREKLDIQVIKIQLGIIKELEL